MIKGILFAVFFVLLAAAITGIVLFAIKAHKVQASWDEITEPDRWTKKTPEISAEVEKDYDKKMHKAKTGLVGAIVTSIALLGLVICIPGSFHQVEAGTVAVVKRLGQIKEIHTPGTYFDFYMTHTYEIYDATVQQVEINTMAYSKDGQTMELEVYLQYQIQLDKLVLKDAEGKILQTEGIAGKYVTLGSLQARIETVTVEKTKAVMSSAEAMTIIQNRSKYSEDVSSTVRTAIGADYYVNVQDVVLTNIDFTDDFEKSVENKVIAEQDKQASITRAEAELEVAKLEAQKKIEEARGNAEAQKILAQATAEAATYKIIELAKSIGYDVNETYIYSVNGVEVEFNSKQVESDTTIYVGTKYVVDTTSGPGADKFKALIEDYLKYLAYLEQWDGKLPDVVAGDDALSIIVPGSGN